MFKIEPTCSKCAKDIKGNEEVYVKMRYPTIRGMTEIKAYINNHGKIICENCYKHGRRKND